MPELLTQARPKTELIEPITLKVPEQWQHQTSKNSSLAQAFYHASSGIIFALKNERMFRIHLLLAMGAVFLGLMGRFDLMQWIAALFSVGLIVAMELVNTAVERVADLMTRGSYHHLAREAKDVAAGAVLFSIVLGIAVVATCFLYNIKQQYFALNI
ncbi:MAG: diacylglycerol kinase family protein [Candidatus Obscuribacterales bacterium]|nr:diacylglycerol kinase family protein [Candidatus Obscuribacterales bacterium]